MCYHSNNSDDIFFTLTTYMITFFIHVCTLHVNIIFILYFLPASESDLISLPLSVFVKNGEYALNTSKFNWTTNNY